MPIKVKVRIDDEPAEPRQPAPENDSETIVVPVRVNKGRRSATTHKRKTGQTGGRGSASRAGAANRRKQRVETRGRKPAKKVEILELPKSTWLVLTRRTLIAAGSLFVIFLLAGVAFIYLSKDNDPLRSLGKPVTGNPPPIRPVRPAPSAPESAAVTFNGSPVRPAEQMNLSVQTLPESKCVVSVIKKPDGQKEPGPKPGVADEFGTVSWAWMISKSAPQGNRTAVVTCSYRNKSAVVQADFVVKQ